MYRFDLLRPDAKRVVALTQEEVRTSCTTSALYSGFTFSETGAFRHFLGRFVQ
jgi:hypothetical protein